MLQFFTQHFPKLKFSRIIYYLNDKNQGGGTCFLKKREAFLSDLSLLDGLRLSSLKSLTKSRPSASGTLYQIFPRFWHAKLGIKVLSSTVHSRILCCIIQYKIEGKTKLHFMQPPSMKSRKWKGLQNSEFVYQNLYFRKLWLTILFSKLYFISFFSFKNSLMWLNEWDYLGEGIQWR